MDKELQQEQDGGGLQKAYVDSEIEEVKQLFRDAGFTSQFIRAHSRQIKLEYDEHWRPYHFRNKYAENLLKSAGFHDTISKTLERIGVKQSAATTAESLVKHFLGGSMYTNFQVAEYALEILLGRYQPLTSPTEPYFFSTNTVNKWVPFESTKLMNLPFSCTPSHFTAVTDKIQQLNTFINNNTNVPKKLYFHTTNWKSAVSIQNQIVHEYGRKCLDFGLLPSFYLSDSLSNSLEWGVKNVKPWQKEVAIVVFGIPETFPDTYKVKWFTTPSEEWSVLTTESRKCPTQDFPSEIASIRRCDFIYGPMVKNPEKVVSHNQPPTTHTPPKFQLVSKTTNSDRFLQRYLKGILVFRKE